MRRYRNFFGFLAKFASYAIAGVLFSSPASADDARWSFPQQYIMSSGGVNLQTGRFIYSKTDISIGDMKFTRTWGEVPALGVNNRSLGILDGGGMAVGWVPLTAGWSHNFNQGVYYWWGSNTSLPRIYVVAGGKVYTFVQLSDGGIGPADQSTQGTRLELPSGNWVFTDRAGNVFSFFPHSAIPQGNNPGALNQLLQSVTYANGVRQDYSYRTDGRPRFIASNTGFAIGLEYDGNGNVSSACGFNLARGYADASTPCASAPIRTSYAYDAAGKTLTSVTDSTGQVVSMTYKSLQPTVNLLSCVTLPNSSTCEIRNTFNQQVGGGLDYSLPDQVTVQTKASGAIWSYTYNPQPDPMDVPVVLGQPRYSRSRMTDPNGAIYGFRFDRGHLTQHYTPGGTTEYRYAYRLVSIPFSGSEPTNLEYFDTLPGLMEPPEVNREFFAHDNRQNLIQHSYWPKNSANPAAPTTPGWDNCCIAPGIPAYPAGSITYTRTFLGDQGFTSIYAGMFVLGCGSGPADAKRCDKPLSLIDPDGNTTDYTYDTQHGGVLTETAPAVNGVRAQTRYTYAQRYAWVSAAGGGYVRAANPVWVLTQKSLCKTGAASGAGCAIAGDEVRTTYDYGPDSGPNNLLLRGAVEDATGAQLRTCYSYDWQGNRVSETKPRAGLGVCP